MQQEVKKEINRDKFKFTYCGFGKFFNKIWDLRNYVLSVLHLI